MFYDIAKNAFENIVGKEENAGNQHFLLFPQSFLVPEQNFNFWSNLLFCLQTHLIWTGLKCQLVKS